MCISIVMRAIFYQPIPVGWAACQCLKRFWPGCLSTSWNGLTLREVDRPKLPGDDWVRVKTRMGGICGSDLAIVAQKQPPDSILQAYTSFPMALGHESVAEVTDVGPAVDGSWVGRRVCVEPTLGCVARGIEPLCDRCAQGEFGACENFGSGGKGAYGLPAGSSIGYNSATGGSFGDEFVAHVSQLIPVPDDFSDEQAVLVDPLACSLHAVLRAKLPAAGRVLVYGAGVLGLGAIAALRAVGYAGQIHALDLASYLDELAMTFGADKFVRLAKDNKSRFAKVAKLTGGAAKHARFGNYMLSGGYDVVFDCVGSRQSIQESLKWTRPRGQTVLVGTGHGGRLDVTPIWFTELTVLGAYGRQMEHYQGRRVSTYELVLELMSAGKIEAGRLLTHTFGIDDYRKAFEVGLNKSRYEAIKIAFDFR